MTGQMLVCDPGYRTEQAWEKDEGCELHKVGAPTGISIQRAAQTDLD